MLAPKVNKKKNAINIIVLLIILAIIFFVIYSNFLAGKMGGGSSAQTAKGANTDIKPVNKISKDGFELDVLEDDKFLELVEFSYERTDLSELKIGKDDPFEIDELLEVANRGRRR